MNKFINGFYFCNWVCGEDSASIHKSAEKVYADIIMALWLDFSMLIIQEITSLGMESLKDATSRLPTNTVCFT